MSKKLEGHYNLKSFEIVHGQSNDIWGLQLRSDTSEPIVWWMTEQDLIRLHKRIHWELNLNDESLKKKGAACDSG